ncbi:MAG: hypothetical protein IRY89_14710 [Pseudolabrys sp.]|nr:hypothetical protein [Pseudolabrys sp.]
MAMDAQAQAAAPTQRDEYETLLALLSASAQGRAFLAEFARRNRQADTELILAALRRLEERILARPRLALVPTPAPPDAGAPRSPAAARGHEQVPARTTIPAVDWAVDAASPTAGETAPGDTGPGDARPGDTGPGDGARPGADAAAALAALMALGEEERLALFS